MHRGNEWPIAVRGGPGLIGLLGALLPLAEAMRLAPSLAVAARSAYPEVVIGRLADMGRPGSVGH